MAKKNGSEKAPTQTKLLTTEVKTGTPRRLIGIAKVMGFQETDAGVAYAKGVLTLKDVKDLNRQRLTDCANDMRVGQSTQSKLKKLRAANATAKAEIDAIMRKHGIVV